MPGPKNAMTNPPIAGPTARMMLNDMEVIAVAFINASRGTVFAMRTWRTGLFAAHRVPNRTANTYRCHSCCRSFNSTSANAKTSSVTNTWSTSSSFSLSIRSAITPVTGDSSSGSVRTPTTAATCRGSSVRS